MKEREEKKENKKTINSYKFDTQPLEMMSNLYEERSSGDSNISFKVGFEFNN